MNKIQSKNQPRDGEAPILSQTTPIYFPGGKHFTRKIPQQRTSIYQQIEFKLIDKSTKERLNYFKWRATPEF